jgi:Ca2+/Na+ antiporter
MSLKISTSLLASSTAPIKVIGMGTWVSLLTLVNAYFACRYYSKITKTLLHRTAPDNVFMRGIFLCLFNNVPRVVALALLFGKSEVHATSLQCGSCLFAITVILALTVLFSRQLCIIHHMVFYKDILFIEITYLVLLFTIASDGRGLDRNAVFSIIALALFLSNTYALPSYLSQPTDIDLSEPHASMFDSSLEALMTPVRLLFDILVLDPSTLVSGPIDDTSSYVAIFSPLFNFLVGIVYFGISLKRMYFAVLAIISLLLGIILYVLTTKKLSAAFISLYSFCSSVLCLTIIMRSSIDVVEYSKVIFDLGEHFLSGTFLTWQASVVDIVMSIECSRKGHALMAMLSALYTPILLTLIGFCNLKILMRALGGVVSKEILREPIIFFTFSFMMISMPIIFVNYAIRHQKLTRDLAIFLLILYFLYLLSFCMEGRPFVSK